VVDVASAVAIGEREDPSDVVVEGDLGSREPLEVGLGAVSYGEKALDDCAALAALLLLLESADVVGVYDLLMSALGASVSSDLVGPGIEDELGGGRLEREDAPRVSRWNAVQIALELNATERACAYRLHDARVVGVRG
jgi:hypothetical protein